METIGSEADCRTYEIVRPTRTPPIDMRFAFRRTPEGQVNLETHEIDPVTGRWAVSQWGAPFPAHAMNWFVRVHTAPRLVDFLDWYFDTEIVPILLARYVVKPPPPRLVEALVRRWLDSPNQLDYAHQRAGDGMWASADIPSPA